MSGDHPPARDHRIPTRREVVYSAGELVALLAGCEVLSGSLMRHTQLGGRVQARPPLDAVVSWSGHRVIADALTQAIPEALAALRAT